MYHLVSFKDSFKQDHFIKRKYRKLTVFFLVVLGALLSHMSSSLTYSHILLSLAPHIRVGPFLQLINLC